MCGDYFVPCNNVLNHTKSQYPYKSSGRVVGTFALDGILLTFAFQLFWGMLRRLLANSIGNFVLKRISDLVQLERQPRTSSLEYIAL